MSSPYRPHLPPVLISLIPPSDQSRNSARILSPTTQRSSRQITDRFSLSRSGSFPPVSARLIATSSRTPALLSENTSSTIISSTTYSSSSSSSLTTNLNGEKIHKNKSTQSLTHTPLKSPEVVREPWVTTTSSSFAVYSKSESPQLTSDRFASKGGFRKSQSSDKLSLINKNSEILIRETQALTESLQKELALASSLYEPSSSSSSPPLAAACHPGYLSSSSKLEACTRAISGITTSAAARDQLSASLINLLSIISDAVQSSIPPLSVIDDTSPKQHAVIDISEAKIEDVYLHRSTSWLSSGSVTMSANATNDKQEASSTVEATVDAIIRPHRRHVSSDNSYDGFRSFLSSTDSFSIDDASRTSQTARQPRYGRRSGDDASHSQSWKSRDSSGSMASFDSGVDDVGRAVAKSTTILGRAGLQISSSTSTSQNVSLGSPTPSSFLSVGGNGNTWSTHQQRSKIGSSSQLRRNSMPACVPGVPRLVFADSAPVSSGFIEAPSHHLPHHPLPSSSSNTTSHENSSPEAMDLQPRRPKLSFQDEFVSMVWNNPDGEMSLTWRELLAELPNTN